MNKIKCNVCGLEMIPEIKNHYISRNAGKIGLNAVVSGGVEPELFDSFDCPQCGSQIIMQGRKRIFKEDAVEDND